MCIWFKRKQCYQYLENQFTEWNGSVNNAQLFHVHEFISKLESKCCLPIPQFYGGPFILLDIVETVPMNIAPRCFSKDYKSLWVRRIRLIFFMLKHCIPEHIIRFNINLSFNFVFSSWVGKDPLISLVFNIDQGCKVRLVTLDMLQFY